ncbi:hypothetical protein LVJ94_40165 [Pendulispora rubella]|uniref:DUF1554 domain-containing protein n=1 Tax=Pendulispora rubella TaxID=2741070 RepID=A0ABZ2KWP5_9BACT
MMAKYAISCLVVTCLLAMAGAACSSALDVGTNIVDAGDAGDAKKDVEDHATIGPPDAKRMFVTGAAYTADLATQGRGESASPEKDPGADGADKLCTTAAAAAHLGGMWRAWISSYASDKDAGAGAHHAIDRIADVPGGWYNVRRTARLFANKSNLMTVPDVREWHAGLEGPSFVQDEYGNRIADGIFVWTGTDSGGQLDRDGATCKAWTSASNANAQVGAPAGAPNEWTDWTSNPCERRGHLYCFEQ